MRCRRFHLCWVLCRGGRLFFAVQLEPHRRPGPNDNVYVGYFSCIIIINVRTLICLTVSQGFALRVPRAILHFGRIVPFNKRKILQGDIFIGNLHLNRSHLTLAAGSLTTGLLEMDTGALLTFRNKSTYDGLNIFRPNFSMFRNVSLDGATRRLMVFVRAVP